MAGLPPPHAIFDSFLDPDAAQAILAQMVGSEGNFEPARVRQDNVFKDTPEVRSSLRLPGRVGVDLAPLVAAIRSRFKELCEAVGMKPFDYTHVERSIVGYGDGDFYAPHIDTRTSPPSSVSDVRMLSCVYYLHRNPKPFSGGELALHDFGGDETVRIAPSHNRLAVFPSFVLHEVLPVAISSDAFEDRRFSANVWLRKARSAG